MNIHFYIKFITIFLSLTNKKNKIDSEAIAKYLIILNNNTINMHEYPDLKEYINTYFRIERKLNSKEQYNQGFRFIVPGNNLHSRYKCKALQ